MKRVTSIEQLQKGSKIVRVNGGTLQTLEFIYVHPHNEKYSVFLDENYDGAPKFYNPRLEEEEWYLFNDTVEDWNEIYDMKIAQLQREIEYIEEYRRKYNK